MNLLLRTQVLPKNLKTPKQIYRQKLNHSPSTLRTITGIAMFMVSFISGCSHTITGEINDENGATIAVNGKINITGLGPSAATATILDITDDGTFESDVDLEKGEYLVEPLIPGYEYGSAKINLDGSQHLKFTIKKKDEQKARVFSPNQFIKVGRGSGDVNLTPPKY